MTLIEVVLLSGVHCLSPVEEAKAATIVAKVPCAVVIRLDDKTGDVDFTPPAAASNPQVIAMLVKPPAEEALPVAEVAKGDAEEAPPPKLNVTRKKTAASPAKPVERRKLASAAKKQRSAKRKDACGSYKAVWYTNKSGHRRYRCVRTG
jgi:hypothetical protein